MGSSSTVFTVGTLLSRAESSGTRVRVLVEGNWIAGTPLVCDGHGVILETPEDGQYLVRVEAITAVAYDRLLDSGVPHPCTSDAFVASAGPSGY